MYVEEDNDDTKQRRKARRGIKPLPASHEQTDDDNDTNDETDDDDDDTDDDGDADEVGSNKIII